MTRFIAPVGAAFAMSAFAACSADARDFQEQGEMFIEGDEVRERMGGVRMRDAECQEPADTEKDTIYACSATGTDDNTWTFQIEITGATSLLVISGEVVTTDAPVDSVVTDGTDSTGGDTTVAATSTTVPPTTTAPA